MAGKLDQITDSFGTFSHDVFLHIFSKFTKSNVHIRFLNSTKLTKI